MANSKGFDIQAAMKGETPQQEQPKQETPAAPETPQPTAPQAQAPETPKTPPVEAPQGDIQPQSPAINPPPTAPPTVPSAPTPAQTVAHNVQQAQQPVVPSAPQAQPVPVESAPAPATQAPPGLGPGPTTLDQAARPAPAPMVTEQPPMPTPAEAQQTQPPVQPTQAAPVGSVPAQNQMALTRPQSNMIQLAVPQMPQSQNPAVQGFVFGHDKIERYEIEKLKVSKGIKARIAVLSVNPGIVRVCKFHYAMGINFFYCFDGQCCVDHGETTTKYVFPVLVYNTDASGQAIANTEWSLKYMILAAAKAEALETMHQNFPITDADFVLVLDPSKPEKFQDYSFNMAGAATWKQNPAWQNKIAEIQETFNRLWPKIDSKIAKTVTPAEYAQEMNRLAQQNTSGHTQGYVQDAQNQPGIGMDMFNQS